MIGAIELGTPTVGGFHYFDGRITDPNRYEVTLIGEDCFPSSATTRLATRHESQIGAAIRIMMSFTRGDSGRRFFFGEGTV
jgi:hypothetical protein